MSLQQQRNGLKGDLELTELYTIYVMYSVSTQTEQKTENKKEKKVLLRLIRLVWLGVLCFGVAWRNGGGGGVASTTYLCRGRGGCHLQPSLWGGPAMEPDPICTPALARTAFCTRLALLLLLLPPLLRLLLVLILHKHPASCVYKIPACSFYPANPSFTPPSPTILFALS
eukprot:COSAG05_NODE_2652_length_2800_cov_2.215476_2_plen_170_part_00